MLEWVYMSPDFFLITALIVIGFAIVVWLITRQINQLKSTTKDDEETRNIVNQVFGELSHKMLKQTQSVLKADKEAIYKDNQNKKQVIENLVKDLKVEISKRQEEIRGFEKDRNRKFGEITKSIEEHRKITQELKTSTQALEKTLSNNQVRGQWGERIIEDILVSAGLVEGTHYEKQKTLGSSAVKPDITLLLPNKRKVAIDVKFPYSQIQQMTLTDSKESKKTHLKLFEKDLREKVTQIEKRGYININEGTLDYAIMFVPNELLFSFINQKFPNIVDEAMNKKIMIVSPFTFLIVARTVMESYRNFMVENNLRKIIKHISQFTDEWNRFTKEFDKFDDTIIKLREYFDKIQNTRYSRMNLRMKRIQEYQQGNQLSSGKK
jgi:DNA recombination protein RmuC